MGVGGLEVDEEVALWLLSDTKLLRVRIEQLHGLIGSEQRRGKIGDAHGSAYGGPSDRCHHRLVWRGDQQSVPNPRVHLLHIASIDRLHPDDGQSEACWQSAECYA